MTVIEFVVVGPPVSHQTKNKRSLRAWQTQVRAEAGKVWTQAPVKGPLKCIIMHFLKAPTPRWTTTTW